MGQKNERLTEVRLKAKKSQRAVAEAVGCDASMINKIEKGKKEPRRWLRMNLARYFNVSPAWLFYEEMGDLQSTTSRPTGTDGQN